MAKYASGNQERLRVGFTNNNENDTSLRVVGNVGIGTTVFDASSSLDVRGDANISGTLISNNLNVPSGQVNLNQLSVSGVSTFNGNVGLSTNLSVAGISTFNNETFFKNNVYFSDGDIYFYGQLSGEDIFWDTSDGSLIANDNASFAVGTGKDLVIYHNGTNSYIDNQGQNAGDLYIRNSELNDNSNIYIQANDLKHSIIVNYDGNVELYNNGSKKLETNTNGISVSNGTSDTATIIGPENLIIDPAVVGNNTGVVRIKGDLFVDGTQTQINSTTIELADFVVGIATTATSDLLADGAGIEIGPDNTFKYHYNGGTNPSLKSSENLNVASGKAYQIDQTEVLNATTLGSGVVNSSLTSVGNLTSLTVDGRIVGAATSNVIPFLYSNLSDLPSASTYHGAFAHVHGTGAAYYAHAGYWLELVNKDTNGNVGLSGDLDVDGHTELDNLNVSGVSTFVGNIDANGGLDVTGHTETDTLNVSGVSTFQNDVHFGDGDKINLGDNDDFQIFHHSNGTGIIQNAGSGQLQIRSDEIRLLNQATDEDYAFFRDDGAVELYYDNSKKFETTGIGVSIYDDLNIGTGVTIYGNSGIVSATSFYGDGSNLLNTGATLSAAAGTQRLVLTSLTSGTMVDAATDADLTFNASTNTLSAANLIVTNAAEFDGNVRIDSTLSANGSVGTSGQYLQSTGIGVSWASFPTLRTTQTNTASAGQTTFNFSYNVNFLDVFVNGVKLTSAEYTASNGSQIILNTPAFAGEVVEFHSYNTTSYGGGGGGGGGASNLNDLSDVSIGSLADDQLLQYNNSTSQWINVSASSVVNAASSFATKSVTPTTATAGQTTFSGTYTVGFVDVYLNGVKLSEDQYTATTGTNIVLDEGASANDIIEVIGLTSNVPASGGGGSSIIVQNSQSVIGAPGTIDFGTGLSVSAISAGVATVTASLTETDTLDTVTGRGASTTNDVSVGKLTVDKGQSGFAVGKLDIEDKGTYSQIQFYNNIGDPKVALKGVADNLYIEGGSGIIRLHTYANFSSTGSVVLNDGGNGGTDIEGTLNVSGISTFNDKVAIGTDAISNSGKLHFPTADGYINRASISVGNPIIDYGLYVVDSTSNPNSNLHQNYVRQTTSGNYSVSVGALQAFRISNNNSSSSATGDPGGMQDNQVAFVVQPNTSTELRYNYNTKLETTGYGVTVTGGVNASGIVTAASFSGNGNDIVHSTWTLGANGSSHYTFTGPGGLSNTDDPKIYLARGQTYEFVNNSGGSHPFQIQQSNGSAYSTGVTNNGASSGTIRFEVPFSAPNTLQYKCTSHSSMGNTIIVYPDISP